MPKPGQHYPSPPNVCKACGGTKISSKGLPCIPCGGTGVQSAGKVSK